MAQLEKQNSSTSGSDQLWRKMSQTSEDTISANSEVEEVEASCGGHGTLEIQDIITRLEKARITPCVLVGVSALQYYGAARMRDVSHNTYHTGT